MSIELLRLRDDYSYKKSEQTGTLYLLLGKKTLHKYRGRTLGCNWDKGLKSFPPCYTQSPLLPPPLSKSGLKLNCNENIVYGNLKSEKSQDFAQKLQRNCTFMTLWMRSSRLWMRSSRVSGWDLAEWFERLTANAVIATVLGSIPASSDTMNLRGGRWSSVEYHT